MGKLKNLWIDISTTYPQWEEANPNHYITKYKNYTLELIRFTDNDSWVFTAYEHVITEVPWGYNPNIKFRGYSQIHDKIFNVPIKTKRKNPTKIVDFSQYLMELDLR